MIDRNKLRYWQMCASVVITLAWQVIGISVVRAQTPAAIAPKLKTTTIVDFSSDALIKKISVGDGVSISRLPDDALEVRIAPFSQSKNQWPTITFGPQFFGKPINLANYSSLQAVLEQKTAGISNVSFEIATAPDGTRNVDYQGLMIPSHSVGTVRMNLNTLLSNDPSQIALIQIVFRPRQTETVYRIEPIRAVYDPANGSPTEELLSKLNTAKESYNELESLPSTLPPDQRAAAQQKIADVGGQMSALLQDVITAQSDQFYKSYRTLSRRADALIGDISKLRFLGAGPIVVWEPDRYLNFTRHAGPNLRDKPLKQISVRMAGNQFSDYVFSVVALDHDVSLKIALKGTGNTPLPASSVEMYHVDYIKDIKREDMGDALLPVDGPITIPAGQSRQFWIRFNTRTVKLLSGHYTFDVVLSDDGRHVNHEIPGQLSVWNFSLPSYDILPNNSYAEFPGSDFATAQGYQQAVRDMKVNGLNRIFVDPPEMPQPTGLNDQWKITGYDDSAFNYRVKDALETWNETPGDGTLHFIFSLSGFEELGLKRSGYAFANAHWKSVFAQWLDHLKVLVANSGLKDDQWMLVLRDESGAPVLMEVEIPLAEAIKSLDPSIQITCNSSAILSDPEWAARYFKAFDVFQPVRGMPEVVQWLRTSGKPIWLYECDTDLLAPNRNLYDYYRMYTWDMLKRGIVGTGVWTYCSQPPSSWGEPGQGCILVYKHPKYGLVHSRRYQLFQESMDDYRYVAALRSTASRHGPEAIRNAESLIHDAITSIMAHPQDHAQCAKWRGKIAERIIDSQ